jgi:phosphoribosylformylglycinamidine synthase subunit PurQ / glutaminase
VASDRSVLTTGVSVGTELVLPVNNFDGSYVCDSAVLDRLRAEDQVILRYADNPNGSIDDIAGICNEGRNVVGLMPHPERASDELIGSTDGLVLLRSLLSVAVA